MLNYRLYVDEIPLDDFNPEDIIKKEARGLGDILILVKFKRF
jgi:hypothetical protein